MTEPRNPEPRKPDPVARLLLWLPLLFILIAVAASIVAMPHLPERMPIHWGVRGEPTRLAPRGVAAFLLIAFMMHAWLLVGLIGWAISRNPDGRGLSPRVMPGVTAGLVGMMLLMHLGALASGLGWPVSVPFVASVGVGVLYVILGYVMRDIPPNQAFGVRTPVTVRDPDAWRAANRVGGWAFVAAGVATILAAPLPGDWPIGVLLASTLLAALAGMVAGRRAARERAGRG